MSFVDQELDQLSTEFSQSVGVGGDNPSQCESATSAIGNTHNQDTFISAVPLDNPTSPSSDTFASGNDGCVSSSLRRTKSESSSTNGSSNIGSIPTDSTWFKRSLIFDDEYNMTHKKRGLCLIFNHREFERNGPRPGTDHDAYCLEKSFQYLGFDVEIHNDLNYADITDILDKTSHLDHSNADCFCCCILTHGEGEDLHARDRSYTKNRIFDFFTGENCPTLAGKPKIFFIQACRGTKVDNGVLVECDAVQNSVSIVKELQCLPVIADFLISYSTAERYYSYRNVTKGGWFVQTLTPLLDQYGSDIDLVSILTAVNKEVAINFGPKPGKQMPQFVSNLTKKIIFRKKPYSTRQLIKFRADQQAQSQNNIPPPLENNRFNENC